MQLMQGDCLELMKHIPDDSIDMILQDPPYNTTACKWEWDIMTKIDEFWAEWKRIIKPNGAIVMTASQPFSSLLVASNIGMFCYQWIWVKSKITGVLNAKRMPVRKHEQVLIFCNKKSTGTYNAQDLIPKNSITKQGGNSNNYGERNAKEYLQEFTNWPRDVLEIQSEGKTVHPTQKPISLMEYLIKTYTNEGDTVFDGFSGSGTTGVACKNTGRKFIGIELDPHYFEISKNRIEAAA